MPCYQPLQGWYACDGEDKGRVIFARQPGVMYIETPLPCGKCIGCKMEYSRQWAIRCMHEAELHDYSCMVTLTYDDDHVPDDGSLRPKDPQDWLKRVRRKWPDKNIKFFLCGEYGDQFQRPHYHVLLYGLDFADDFSYNDNDPRPKRAELQSTWIDKDGKDVGYVHVSKLTYESAAYVARYCLKKQRKEIDYCDTTTGVIRHPEFTRMSRRPGIGAGWLSRFHEDTYKDDTIIVNGNRKSRPPRYYDKRYIVEKGENVLDEIKIKRIEEAFKRRSDSTPEKLRVREIVKKAQLALKTRGYENYG